MQNNSPITITRKDMERLRKLVEARRAVIRDRQHLDALEEELERAAIVDPREMPSDVVTMNSRVHLTDLETGAELLVDLVFPSEANAEEHRISVLAPIGTGLLGMKAESVLEWPVPGGIRRLKINAIEYQPEAAGAVI